MTHKPNKKFTTKNKALGQVRGFSVSPNTVGGYKARGTCPVCEAEDQGGSELNPKIEIVISTGPVDGGADGAAEGGPGGRHFGPENSGVDEGAESPGAKTEERFVTVSCRCACGAAHGVADANSCGATWFVREPLPGQERPDDPSKATSKLH